MGQRSEVSEIWNDLGLGAVVVNGGITGEVISELMGKDRPRKSKRQNIPESGEQLQRPRWE